MFKVREILAVPSCFRALSNEEKLGLIRAPRGKTRLKEPVMHGDPSFDPYAQPLRWKKELEERGVKAEILRPRKDENPVLVYKIH